MNQKRTFKRRNSDATRQQLLIALTEVLLSKGYQSLNANEIARQAGVDKNMVNYHFGSFNNLLKTYLHEMDFWLPGFSRYEQSEDVKSRILELLTEQLERLCSTAEMRCFIHWQLSEYHPVISSASRMREEEAERLVKQLDKDNLSQSAVDKRCLFSLILGGIYFLVLQTNAGNSALFGVDLNKEEYRRKIIETVNQLLEWISSDENRAEATCGHQNG